MQKSSAWKKALYIVSGIVVFLFLAGWIFLNFFADDLISSTVIPKISAAARIATHGRYVLRLGSIKYSHGTVLCQSFDLFRVRYDSSENDMVIRKITIDTVKFTGVNIWDVIWKNPISLKSLEMNAPKLYMIDAGDMRSSPDVIGDSLKLFPPLPDEIPVISFDSIVLRDIFVFLPARSHPGDQPSFQGFNVTLRDFLLDQESSKREPLLFSKRVDYSLQSASHITDDSFYTISVRNLRGSLSDSLMTADSFSYKPNYSEDVYAAKHPVARAAITFQCSKLRAEGINYTKIFAGKSIELRKFEAGTWYIDSYLDRRRPPDIHPDDAPMPNDLLRSLPITINIDSVMMNDGRIRIRERSSGSLKPGVLFFDRTNIAATPICSDSLSQIYGKTTAISVSSYFVGEGLLRVAANFPLIHKGFDIGIHATIGKFDAKKLNTWLIPFERLEVSDGTIESGIIDMNIRSGTATTTVTPEYNNFSMKILSADVKKNRGILEGIKTFYANTFVLRSNNLREKGKPAKSGTASVARHRDEEFMEFLWITLRKSLGKVVGGFK